MLLGAKLGDLWGKLGYREVVFISWAILFGHVVAFASRNALPQQDQDFKWVSASYVGSTWGQGIIFWPRWCQLGANFGDFGAVLKAIWANGFILDMLLRHRQIDTKKPIKNQNLPQNANPHGSKGKTKPCSLSKTPRLKKWMFLRKLQAPRQERH